MDEGRWLGQFLLLAVGWVYKIPEGNEKCLPVFVFAKRIYFLVRGGRYVTPYFYLSRVLSTSNISWIVSGGTNILVHVFTLLVLRRS